MSWAAAWAVVRRVWWLAPIAGLTIALLLTRGTLADVRHTLANERTAWSAEIAHAETQRGLMPRLMLAALPALLLTACAGSTRSTLPFSPQIPPVPAEATRRCQPTPMQRRSDGSANSADAEATIRAARADLAACDARRQLAVDAWPR